MEIFLKWLEGYSVLVVITLAAGAAILFVIRLTLNQFVEKRISLAFRERELRQEHRSAFENRVLEDRYRIFDDIATRLIRITTDLNRLRRGRDTNYDPFIKNGELLPLTEVFEDCQAHRLVLGQQLYDSFDEAARVVLQMSNADSQDQCDSLSVKWDQALNKVREAGEDNFGLDRIQWWDHRPVRCLASRRPPV